MKSIFKLIRFILTLLVLALIFHNWALKTLFAGGLRLSLGVPVYIEAARLDIFHQKVTFEGLLIQNPAGFPRGILAEIPRIEVVFEAAELQQGRLHIPEAVIEIEELRILRAPNGRMNLLGLKVFRPREARGAVEPGAGTSGTSRFQMDRAVISLSRVLYKDARGPKPVYQSFELGIQNAVLENRPGLEGVVEAVVQQSIQSAGLEKILEEAIRSFGLRNWLEEKSSWQGLVAKVKEAL